MMMAPFKDTCNVRERTHWWGGEKMVSLVFDVLPKGTQGRVEHTQQDKEI
jgi:hypothetical protein